MTTFKEGGFSRMIKKQIDDSGFFPTSLCNASHSFTLFNQAIKNDTTNQISLRNNDEITYPVSPASPAGL